MAPGPSGATSWAFLSSVEVKPGPRAWDPAWAWSGDSNVVEAVLPELPRARVVSHWRYVQPYRGDRRSAARHRSLSHGCSGAGSGDPPRLPHALPRRFRCRSSGVARSHRGPHSSRVEGEG